MSELNGGCLCGAVRYKSNSAPEWVGLGHCTDCQKHSGSAFAIVGRLLKTALQIQGTIKAFSKLGDSGNPTRHHFCPKRGSSICRARKARPGMINLHAGTLDDSS